MQVWKYGMRIRICSRMQTGPPLGLTGALPGASATCNGRLFYLIPDSHTVIWLNINPHTAYLMPSFLRFGI